MFRAAPCRFLRSVAAGGGALLALTLGGPLAADDYFVDPAGSDDADGRTRATAWASVERAADAVPAGEHRIRLAPGDYPLARTVALKGGVTLVGANLQWDRKRPDAPRFSVLHPGPDWPRADFANFIKPPDNTPDQYLLRAAKHARGVTVREVRLRGTVAEGDAEIRATGGFHADQAENLTLEGLDVREFRLSGLRLLYCSDLRVAGCRVHNASTEKAPHGNGKSRWGGLIWTAWPKRALFEDCRVTSDAVRGYGFKGGGSDGCRITRCVVEGQYFAIEHPHEHEFGLEIDHCRLGGCISVPKGGGQTDPTKRGHDRSVHIHHNYLTDSYTVEGPRGYLEFAHNWVHVEKPGGRCYTHHGGENRGPVLIHHNLFENVDRSLVWMNTGYFAGLKFYNNTVSAADAGGRSGYLFDSYTADRLDDWEVKNNLIVAAWSRPRRLLPDRNGVSGKIELGRNLFVNLTDVPPAAGTLTPADLPGGAPYSTLIREGDKPAPFYRPTDAASPVVDAGEDVGLPFAGDAPELGAFEFVPEGSDYDDPWADWALPKE